MACPTFETLIDFADGRLPDEELARVERHLSADCADCRDALVWYSGVVATAAADPAADPPAWVVRRTVEAFREAREAARNRGLRGLVSRLRAALVFDSLAADPGAELVAARSSATASRQLLFSADPFDVDLLISPGLEPGRLTVAGQVLVSESDDFSGVGALAVELIQDERVVGSGTTSEFGEFTVEDVPPGRYVVRLASEGREIVLAEAPIALD